MALPRWLATRVTRLRWQIAFCVLFYFMPRLVPLHEDEADSIHEAALALSAWCVASWWRREGRVDHRRHR